MNVVRKIVWALCVGSAWRVCGDAGAALKVIEAKVPDSRIVRLALTPAGTPWVVLETPTDQRNIYAYRLTRAESATLTPTVPQETGVKTTPENNLFSSCLSSCRPLGGERGTAALLGEAKVRIMPHTYCVTGTSFSVSLCGGADRDAWAVMALEGSEEKRLLKLGDGGIDVVETCRAHIKGTQTSVYVARDGRVLNWGESFLAVRSVTGTWTRAEAVLPVSYKGLQPVIIERGDTIFVFESPMLYRVGPEGKITETRIEGMPVGDHNVVAHVWDGTRIVVWSSGFPPTVSAFDITTLQPVAAPFLPKAWNAYQDRAFPTRDGSLWLSGREGDTPVTIQVPPGNRPPLLRPDIPFPVPVAHLLLGPTAVECADGTVASGQHGLTLTSPRGQVQCLGWREGIFGMSSDLQEASDGRLWFVNGGRVLALDRSVPIGPFAGAACWQELPVPESGIAPDILSKDVSAPARSGGFFHYPNASKRLNGGVPEREFDGHRIAVRLVSTPLFDMCVTDINEEADGSVTFLACDGQAMAMLMCGEAAGSKGRKLIHSFRYGPPTGVSFSQVAPAVCGRMLDRPLAVPDVVRWQRVHLARVGDGPWQRVEISAQPTVRFLFPSNSTYRCEVIAFDYGARVSGAASFSIVAKVPTPDTQLNVVQDATQLLDVNEHPWFPPVRTLPSTEGGIRRLLWRDEEETEWRPMDIARGLSVIELGRGERTLLFCTEEDGVWRDPSPVRLRIRVALPMGAYLEAIQQELSSHIPAHRERAIHALRACLPEAQAEQEALKRLVDRQERIAEGIRRLEQPKRRGRE